MLNLLVTSVGEALRRLSENPPKNTLKFSSRIFPRLDKSFHVVWQLECDKANVNGGENNLISESFDRKTSNVIGDGGKATSKGTDGRQWN